METMKEQDRRKHLTDTIMREVFYRKCPRYLRGKNRGKR